MGYVEARKQAAKRAGRLLIRATWHAQHARKSLSCWLTATDERSIYGLAWYGSQLVETPGEPTRAEL